MLPAVKIETFDCAAFCAKGWLPGPRFEPYGKTRREIENDIVRWRCAYNARLGIKRREFGGLGGLLKLIGLAGFFLLSLWFLGGLLAHVAKSLGYVLPGPVQTLYYDWADAHPFVVTGLLTSVFVVFIPLFALGLKLSEAEVETVRAVDPRPPILLLRSFEDERSVPLDSTSFGKVTVLETKLMLGAAGLGPLIAIGRPGEKIDYRGAARAYYSNEDWRRAVLTFMSEAHAIVLVAGRGEGLAWELQQLAANDNLGKSVIVLPPEKDTSARVKRWASLSAALPPLSQFDVKSPDGIVAVYFPPSKAMLVWSSRRLRVDDFDAVLRLSLYGLDSARRGGS